MDKNTSKRSTDQPPRISEPPLSFKEFIKWLGPAFIFTASQIGGGELITVPLMGAYLGMSCLYLAPLIAFIKIFGQFYLVQYGVVRGKTFLQTSWDNKWLRWMFFALMLGCILHSMLLAGLLGQTGGIFDFIIQLPPNVWIIIITVVGFLIVFTRNYNILEKTSSILLWLFLGLITVVAILFWPPIGDWIQGIIPRLPSPIKGLETSSGLMTLAVLFVVLGSGFGPTVSYIWFAKDKKMGMFELYEKGNELELEDLTSEEKERLKGWRKVVLYQNLVSAAILSFFSIMIWVAAAQTLHGSVADLTGDDLIPQMVSIFTTTYGEWSGIIFIMCGALALFSSILGPLYGFSRLWEESFERFGFYNRFKIKKKTVYRICLTFFTLLPMVFILLLQNSMGLFSLASLLTGPILGLMYIIPVGVSYLETREVAPELNPTRYWAIALAIISGVLIFILSIVNVIIGR